MNMNIQTTLFGRQCVNVLPSPPVSPSMYAYPSATEERGWYTTRLVSPLVLPTPSPNSRFNSTESIPQTPDKEILASQSQEEPPRDRRSPVQSSSLHQIITVENSDSASLPTVTTGFAHPDQKPDQVREEDALEQGPTRASSIIPQRTPQLVSTEVEHQSDGDELFEGSEEEDAAQETPKPRAKRLVEKRRTRRFRLTQAQTRYLTSEFSRQPHPDAALREKLSRDIPGLNPRQVQVWFQNKRAKLKRLTTEDQERMRTSRTLPLDFDFSRTLQPTHRAVRPLYGSAWTDPLILGGGVIQRPTPRFGVGYMSTALNSTNSSTPGTGSANQFPIFPVNKGFGQSGLRFSATQTPFITSAQFTNPFGRSQSLSSGPPAFQCQDRPFSQNSMMGLGDQLVTTSAPPDSLLTNNDYDYSNLPPLQYGTTSFQTLDCERFGSAPATKDLSRASGKDTTQHHMPPLSSLGSPSYSQSHLFYPSDSAFRAPSHYQGQDMAFWQGSQMSFQGYQYGQQPQPHPTTEKRIGSESSPSPLAQDPSVNSSIDFQSQPIVLDGGGATGHNTQHPSDAARPRARSEVLPA